MREQPGTQGHDPGEAVGPGCRTPSYPSQNWLIPRPAGQSAEFSDAKKRAPWGCAQLRAPNDDQRSATGAIEAMKRGRIVPKTVQNWGKTVQNWGKTVQNWGIYR